MKPQRAVLHLARADDAPVQVRRLPNESDWHYAQRCESVRRLGVNWLRHPAYRFQPRHSNNPEVWRPAHARWWADTALALAAADRVSNPAYHRAQAMRKLLEST